MSNYNDVLLYRGVNKSTIIVTESQIGMGVMGGSIDPLTVNFGEADLKIFGTRGVVLPSSNTPLPTNDSNYPVGLFRFNSLYNRPQYMGPTGWVELSNLNDVSTNQLVQTIGDFHYLANKPIIVKSGGSALDIFSPPTVMPSTLMLMGNQPSILLQDVDAAVSSAGSITSINFVGSGGINNIDGYQLVNTPVNLGGDIVNTFSINAVKRIALGGVDNLYGEEVPTALKLTPGGMEISSILSQLDLSAARSIDVPILRIVGTTSTKQPAMEVIKQVKEGETRPTQDDDLVAVFKYADREVVEIGSNGRVGFNTALDSSAVLQLKAMPLHISGFLADFDGINAGSAALNGIKVTLQGAGSTQNKLVSLNSKTTTLNAVEVERLRVSGRGDIVTTGTFTIDNTDLPLSAARIVFEIKNIISVPSSSLSIATAVSLDASGNMSLRNNFTANGSMSIAGTFTMNNISLALPENTTVFEIKSKLDNPSSVVTSASLDASGNLTLRNNLVMNGGISIFTSNPTTNVFEIKSIVVDGTASSISIAANIDASGNLTLLGTLSVAGRSFIGGETLIRGGLEIEERRIGELSDDPLFSIRDKNEAVLVSVDTAGAMFLEGNLTVDQIFARRLATSDGVRIGGDLNFSGRLLQNDLPIPLTSQWINLGTADDIFYPLNGNVGIGTTVATERLVVNGAIRSINQSTDLLAGGSSAFMDMVTLNNSKLMRLGTTQGGDNHLADQGEIAVFVNDEEKMRINVAGNVGIGTNNPGARLDVNGNLNVSGDINVTGSVKSALTDPVSATGGAVTTIGGFRFHTFQTSGTFIVDAGVKGWVEYLLVGGGGGGGGGESNFTTGGGGGGGGGGGVIFGTTAVSTGTYNVIVGTMGSGGQSGASGSGGGLSGVSGGNSSALGFTAFGGGGGGGEGGTSMAGGQQPGDGGSGGGGGGDGTWSEGGFSIGGQGKSGAGGSNWYQLDNANRHGGGGGGAGTANYTRPNHYSGGSGRGGAGGNGLLSSSWGVVNAYYGAGGGGGTGSNGADASFGGEGGGGQGNSSAAGTNTDMNATGIGAGGGGQGAGRGANGGNGTAGIVVIKYRI